MDGGSETAQEAAVRLGMPLELVMESDDHRNSDGIFSDNVQTVAAFIDMLTQWRVGTGGVIGLDYGALPFVFRTRNISGADREEVFDGIQIMERAALKAMRKESSS